MSHQAERRALQIFDQYLDDAFQGKKQAVEQYLRQCPESEVEALQEALAGADFLLAYYYCPRVKQRTVDQLLQELQEEDSPERGVTRPRQL